MGSLDLRVIKAALRWEQGTPFPEVLEYLGSKGVTSRELARTIDELGGDALTLANECSDTCSFLERLEEEMVERKAQVEELVEMGDETGANAVRGEVRALREAKGQLDKRLVELQHNRSRLERLLTYCRALRGEWEAHEEALRRQRRKAEEELQQQQQQQQQQQGLKRGRRGSGSGRDGGKEKVRRPPKGDRWQEKEEKEAAVRREVFRAQEKELALAKALRKLESPIHGSTRCSLNPL